MQIDSLNTTVNGIKLFRVLIFDTNQSGDFNYFPLTQEVDRFKGYFEQFELYFGNSVSWSNFPTGFELLNTTTNKIYVTSRYFPELPETYYLINSISGFHFKDTQGVPHKVNFERDRYLITGESQQTPIIRRALIDDMDNNYTLATLSNNNNYAVMKLHSDIFFDKYNYYDIFNLVNGEKQFIKRILYNPNKPILNIFPSDYEFNTLQIEKVRADSELTPFLALQDSFMDIKESFGIVPSDPQETKIEHKPTVMQISEKWKRELIASFPTATTNYRLKSQGIAQSIINRKDIILANWLKWANKPDALEKLEKYVDNDKLADLYDKGLDGKMSFSATEINKVVEGIEKQRKIMNNLTSYRLEIDLHTRNYYWIVDNLPYQIKHQIISQYINKYDKEIGFPDFIDYDARIEFLKYLETNNIIEVRN